ncbi:MAG TPA: hypothetical protein VF469_14425 [Kofleriaceae bacterium]
MGRSPRTDRRYRGAARSVQSRQLMKYMARDTLHSIGERSSDVAKTIGSSTAHLARRVSDRTADLANQVGPRRALIGLAVAAVAIGGTVMLVRFLQARRARLNAGIGREERPASGVGGRTNERVRSPGVEGGLSY